MAIVPCQARTNTVEETKANKQEGIMKGKLRGVCV